MPYSSLGPIGLTTSTGLARRKPSSSMDIKLTKRQSCPLFCLSVQSKYFAMFVSNRCGLWVQISVSWYNDGLQLSAELCQIGCQKDQTAVISPELICPDWTPLWTGFRLTQQTNETLFAFLCRRDGSWTEQTSDRDGGGGEARCEEQQLHRPLLPVCGGKRQRVFF